MKLRLQRASSLSGVLLAKFSVSVSLAPSFKGRFLSSLTAGSTRPRCVLSIFSSQGPKDDIIAHWLTNLSSSHLIQIIDKLRHASQAIKTLPEEWQKVAARQAYGISLKYTFLFGLLGALGVFTASLFVGPSLPSLSSSTEQRAAVQKLTILSNIIDP